MKQTTKTSANRDAVFDAIALGLKPVTPPKNAALRARVLKRIAKFADADPYIKTIPASDLGWNDVIPKIRAKCVFTDGVAESWLIRMEAGARAPAHDHPAREECLVLEGSIRYIGGSTLNAGDYEVVEKGGHHTEVVSEHGALLFLRYALPLNQYLPL